MQIVRVDFHKKNICWTKFRRSKFRRSFKGNNYIAVRHFFPDEKSKRTYKYMKTPNEIKKIID